MGVNEQNIPLTKRIKLTEGNKRWFQLLYHLTEDYLRGDGLKSA